MQWVAIVKDNGHYSIQSPVKMLEYYAGIGWKAPEHTLANIDDGKLPELAKMIGQMPCDTDIGILAEQLRQKGIEAIDVRVFKVVQPELPYLRPRNSLREEIPVHRMWR